MTYENKEVKIKEIYSNPSVVPEELMNKPVFGYKISIDETFGPKIRQVEGLYKGIEASSYSPFVVSNSLGDYLCDSVAELEICYSEGEDMLRILTEYYYGEGTYDDLLNCLLHKSTSFLERKVRD